MENLNILMKIIFYTICPLSLISAVIRVLRYGNKILLRLVVLLHILLSNVINVYVFCLFIFITIKVNLW